MTAEPPNSDAAPADPFDGPEWGAGRSGRVRVRRRRTKGSRRRRRLLIGVACGAFVIVAAALWLIWDGLHARSELQQVKAEVATLRTKIDSGDLDGARALARSLQHHASAAYGDTTSPIWSVGTHLPVVGAPLDDVRGLTTVIHSVATGALPPLVDAATSIDPSRLRRPDGSIDVTTLQGLGPRLDSAHSTLTAAMTSLTRQPRSSWSSVNAARTTLLHDLPHLTKSVASAARALDVAPELLGADGPRSYMITFENDAEMRATGGLPGAFGIVHADNGHLKFTHFEPDNYLTGATADGVHFPGDYDELYGTGQFGSHAEYRNTNLSPNFPYAAQLWIGMWQHKTGERLDGALTLDPTALGYLLRASGPATMPDGTVISSSNVVALTESQIYSRFPVDNAARKQYLVDVAKTVSTRLLGAGVDSATLVRSAALAASESRLLMWVRDPSVEKTLASVPLGGVEPRTTAPYFRLTLWNSTGSKLDYYVHASVDWSSSGCGSHRTVTVTVHLSNEAPDGLPPYVLGETADKEFGIPPGDEYLTILAYGTQNSLLSKYTVNGKAVDPSQYSELGHPVWSDGEFVRRGVPLTLVYTLREPASSQRPIVPAQPMVNPMTVSVHTSSC